MKREVCMFGPCRKITFSYSYIFPSNVAGKLNFQKKGQVLRKLYKYKTFMEYQWIMQRIFIDLVWSLRCSVNRFTHLSLPVVYGESAFWAAGFFFFLYPVLLINPQGSLEIWKMCDCLFYVLIFGRLWYPYSTHFSMSVFVFHCT